MENMIQYPCKECLVTPICTIICYKLFDFMNNVADIIQIYNRTGKHIHIPDMPPQIRFKIGELVAENKRFAYPENIQGKRSILLAS